jgi:SAM-dependent methyltransferase
MKIFDAGSGRGGLIKKLYNSEDEFYGVDVSPVFVADARQLNNFSNCHFEVKKVEEADFPDNFFDQIHCNDVLEHVDDFDKSINNLIRMLKVGGEMYLSIPHPVSQKIISWIDPQDPIMRGHVRIINPIFLKLILKNNNFKIIYYKKRMFLGALQQIYRAWKKIPMEEQSGRFLIEKPNLITVSYGIYQKVANNPLVKFVDALFAQIMPRNYFIKAVKIK